MMIIILMVMIMARDDHDHDLGDVDGDDVGVKKISGEEMWNKHSSSNISARSYIALTL